MKYTQLGNTGIEVSRICVGCMSYGKPSEDFHLWTLDQEETTKMIKHALDLGVNFFDTANGYSHGTSEEFLGKALKDLGVARVAEVAERLGVTMTEVALAWLLKRGVAAPIVGATKVPHFNDAVRALDLDLSDEDAAYLEEPYKAHEVVGAL
ncbi:MAG: aldo/keto reductase [Bacteroidales bacterium]|nr:aldo/keto reductase [Bacteroidales bacterium]